MTEQLTDRQTLFSGEIFSICGGAESNKEDQRKKKTSGKTGKNAEVRAFIVFKKELIRGLKVNNFLLCSCVFDEIYHQKVIRFATV